MPASTRRPVKALFVQHQQDVPPGLIGERAEQRGVEVQVAHAASGGYPDPRAYDFVVPLGSGESAYDDDVPWISDERAFLRTAVDAAVPIFGICFGSQILADVLGGAVRPGARPEIGWMRIETDAPDLIDPGPWLVWHFDVLSPPPGGREVARTDLGAQAFVAGPHVGVQFHPEATPASVASWARTYKEALRELGVTREEFVDQTRRGLAAGRRRAYTLFDRFFDRCVLPQASAHAR